MSWHILDYALSRMNKHSTEFNRNVLTVRFEDISSGWEQWVLLSADRHHDNIYCNRTLEKAHLEQAKEREALILDFGDVFCAMQGKYDPRASKDVLREEDKVDDYLDAIVRHAEADYAPYADNWALMGRGNHDQNILKRHGVDIVNSLVDRLRDKHGSDVRCGGYGGWIRFMFKYHRTSQQSIRLKYHHGAGGGGPVTKGVIQTNRQAVYLRNADIVVNGHTHDAWIVPISNEGLSETGVVKRGMTHFVRTPGYQDEYFKSEGIKGHVQESWQPPKPIGAVWLRFWMERDEILFETTLAVR